MKTALSRERWLVVAAVLGSSMAFIDGSVVNLALPALQRSLGASESGAQWIVEAYLVTLAALLLVGGTAGDVFGHGRVFSAGAVLFAIASAACGVSRDLPQLILARAVQGIGGALLVPGSLALINAHVDRARRSLAIGSWSGWLALTGAVGPVLGGWIVQHESWRWVFFLNVPISAAVLVIVRRAVKDEVRRGGSLDWLGAVLAMVGLGAIVLGLLEWRRGVTLVATTQATGIAALVALFFVERRVAAPMIPRELFRSRAFTGANVYTLLLYTALSGLMFFLPLDLIQVQHFTATQAGASMLPFVVLMSTLSRKMGAISQKTGPRLLLASGAVVAAAGLVLLMLPSVGVRYVTGVFPGITLMALGMTIVVAPLTSVVMSSVADEHAGAASGINNAVSRVAALLAIAVLGVLAGRVFSSELPERLAQHHVAAGETQHVLADSDRLAAIEAPSDASRAAVDESFVGGFRVVLAVCAGLALAAAAVARVTIPGRERDLT